jgi:hypothetical protein
MIEELVKIIGHSLNGRNLILNPVITDITERIFRKMNDII